MKFVVIREHRGLDLLSNPAIEQFVQRDVLSVNLDETFQNILCQASSTSWVTKYKKQARLKAERQSRSQPRSTTWVNREGPYDTGLVDLPTIDGIALGESRKDHSGLHTDGLGPLRKSSHM